MIYATVCSGIDAPAVAWKPLGWTQAFSSDIEPFPNAVRAHHDPDVPNYGDMTKFREWPDHDDLGLICAGTPCQAFSVAGLRKGLDDPRGNLTLVFLGILDRYRPEWVVWENVPGVLSIDGGRVFGTFLGGLGQLGYGFAYRVLDAQYFGVPQRRRRVFVVGHLGDWRRAAAVLFERSSMRGDSPPRRTTEQGAAATSTSGAANGGPAHGQRSGHARESNLIPQVAPTMRAGGNRTGGDRPPGTDVDTCDSLIPVPHADLSPALKARDSKGPSSDGDGDGAILVPMVAHSLRAEVRTMDVAGALAAEPGAKQQTYIAFSSKDHGADASDIAPTLRSMNSRASNQNGGGQVVVAFHNRQDPDVSGSITHPIGAKDNGLGVALRGREGGATAELGDDVGHALRASSGGGDKPHVLSDMQVRRLTPRECERLQGFPDNYTLITVRGKPAADGPRYKALGNSMAVPVMRWIGERVQMVEELTEVQKVAA